MNPYDPAKPVAPHPATSSLSYHARRLNMVVDVTVENGIVDWRYRAAGDEWKNRIPLTRILPCPMLSIDRSCFVRSLALVLMAPIAIAFVLSWLDVNVNVAIGAAIVAFLWLTHRCAPCLLGPIEWAVFDTTLDEKTIYVFRDPNKVAEFDDFVAALEQAVLDAESGSSPENHSPRV